MIRMPALLGILVMSLGACAHQEAAPAAPPSAMKEEVIQPEELSPEQMRMVQRSLAERGYAVEFTGKLDPATQAALAGFQQARGLHADGMLSMPTVAALGIDPREVAPVRGPAPRAEPSEPVPAPAAPPEVEPVPKGSGQDDPGEEGAPPEQERAWEHELGGEDE